MYFCSPVPGSHPQNVTAVALTSTSIHVQWDPPEVQNGVIDGYRVFVTEAETGDVTLETTNVTQVFIENLHPFYTYHCLIVAFTVGDGPNVSVSVVTKEDG